LLFAETPQRRKLGTASAARGHVRKRGCPGIFRRSSRLFRPIVINKLHKFNQIRHRDSHKSRTDRLVAGTSPGGGAPK
jgi:hypothetical protein